MELISAKKWGDRSLYERVLLRAIFYIYIFAAGMLTGAWIFDIDGQALIAGLTFIL